MGLDVSLYTKAEREQDDRHSAEWDAAIGVTEAQAELPRLARRQRAAERYAARGGAA